ncbi:MAG TPA: ADOP family duplicated permease [Gemmatimonadales bacterium]|nr:ADOP family duplicated permease [Gemmatimonadales bacterium]
MNWLAAVLRRRRESREHRDEIQSHLDERTDELIAGGMPPAEARLEARRTFGNVTGLEETAREVWRVPLLDAAVDDLRYAFRSIRRHPAFAVNVMLVTAVGIAACATTFGVVSGVLLSPVGFPNPDRVYDLFLQGSDDRSTAAIPLDIYDRIAGLTSVVEAVGWGYPWSEHVDWNGEPELATSWRVSPSYFRVYGAAPELGRVFTDDDLNRAPVIILGDEVWRRRFNADRGALGKTVTIGDTVYTVVGVMPRGFRGFAFTDPAFWILTRAPRAGTVNAQLRVRAGVDSASAEAILMGAVPLRRVAREFGDTIAATPVLVPIREYLFGSVRDPLRIIFGAVLLVLALVAANVATMQLARTAARDGELALREAIGASTWRQIRLLVTESLLLTGIGGAVGVALSMWATRWVARLGSLVLNRIEFVTFDWRVLTFALVATAVVGVVGGIVPALVARRSRSIGAASTRLSGARVSSSLVVTQVAITVLLLVGAGLLVKGFLRILPSHPGFRTANRAAVSVMLFDLPGFRTSDTTGARRLVEEVRTRMAAVPGVEGVAAMSFAPMTGMVWGTHVAIPGEPQSDRPHSAYRNDVTANWFALMGIPLQEGRAFREADGPGAPPVVVVNQTAAEKWWPGERTVVGRQLIITDPPRYALTVVGVSRDVRFLGGDLRSRPEIYVPVRQADPLYITFIAATTVPPGRVSHALTRAVWAVAPRLPLTKTTDLESIAMESVQQERFYTWALGAFAVASVVLSALAVYGLLAFTVARRRREIGIRLAVGASPGRIGRSVLLRAALLGGSGILLGEVAGVGLTRLMASLLTEVKPTDATVFFGAALGALVVVIVAATAPAFRAVHVDPVLALRTE